MTDDAWEIDGKTYGWVMPYSPWWKRLPIIRHFRFIYYSYCVTLHNEFYTRIGLLPTGYDKWVLYGIWKGRK